METAANPPAPTENPLIGYCRSCGKPVHEGEGRPWQGALHCLACIVETDQASPSGAGTGVEEPSPSEPPPASPSPAQPDTSSSATTAPDRASPVLALVLGFVPGLGAVYNGQYAKGVAHVVIFGGLLSILGSDAASGLEAMFGMLTALMYFYMPVEAYRTARALEAGRPVDELSGFLPPGKEAGRSPGVGITLIVVGVVFLLHSLGYWRIVNLLPYWPVSLIGLGVYLLYRRIVEAEQPGGRGSSDEGTP